MEPTTHNLEITNDALACRMFGKPTVSMLHTWAINQWNIR